MRGKFIHYFESMASRRISAEKARRRILHLASDDSGDESGRETDLKEEPHIPDSDDSSSDDDQPEVLRIRGRDGSLWRHVRDVNLGTLWKTLWKSGIAQRFL